MRDRCYQTEQQIFRLLNASNLITQTTSERQLERERERARGGEGEGTLIEAKPYSGERETESEMERKISD